jgi:hypothetical protein
MTVTTEQFKTVSKDPNRAAEFVANAAWHGKWDTIRRENETDQPVDTGVKIYAPTVAQEAAPHLEAEYFNNRGADATSAPIAGPAPGEQASGQSESKVLTKV